jgi:hypothetical protein
MRDGWLLKKRLTVVPGLQEETFWCRLVSLAKIGSKRALQLRAGPSSKNATRHNARHRRAQEFRALFTSVPKHFQMHARNRQFSPEFETCDGSKNRRLRRCKISLSEVLISVTLSVHGEVAERLKAAVC